MPRTFWVYILTNQADSILYIGVTNDLVRRINEHRAKIHDGFSQKYHLSKLVYLEESNDPLSAIEREKQLKRWTRAKKISLIQQLNPYWKDLYTSE